MSYCTYVLRLLTAVGRARALVRTALLSESSSIIIIIVICIIDAVIDIVSLRNQDAALW